MKDQEQSKEQLLDELKQLSQRIAQLEESEARHKEVQVALQESEQRFRKIAEISGEFIWEVDNNGLYTYANPVVEEILGYKPEEIVGKKYFYDFFIPDIRDALKKAAFEVFAGKAVFRNFVNPNVRKNGTIVILETSGLPVMDKQGNLIGYRGSDRDITARKKAEETLRVSEERYKSMVNAVTLYTYSVYLGQEGTISTKHSIGCIPITGYNPEEYESDPYLWHNMIYPADKVMIESTIKEIMAGHKVPPIEHRLIRRDGIVIWVRNTLVPYYDLFGRLIQYDGLIEDITERKIAEDKIKKLNEELEKKVAELTEANKELEAFNRTVSHDLQTPLTLIGGFSSRYLKIYGDKLDTDEIDMISIIQTNAQKMERLIKDLLAFSRSGRQEIKPVKIELRNLIATVLDELTPLSEGRKIKFDIKSLPSVYGDKGLIKQALVNLLSNAIKFTQFKDSALIEVGYIIEKDENIFYIKDNGIGFNFQMAEDLFSPFYRLDEAKGFEGTGIGLTIVQRIINRHGGRVWAEGKINEGATFYFSLPINRSSIS